VWATLGDSERLQDPADRLTGLGAEQQVKVAHHQAVAEYPERIPTLGLAQGLEKGQIVCGLEKNGFTVVPTVKRVIEQTISYRSRSAWHSDTLRGKTHARQGNNELTPVFHPYYGIGPRR
jgi:hypothetical protein